MDVYSGTRDLAATQSTTQQLVDLHLAEFKEALVKHVTAQFQQQERLLEEAKRDLVKMKRDMKVYKRAFFSAERDRHDLEERFEREKQALNDEIRQLRERDTHAYEERLEQERQVLKDAIFQFKAIVTREKRAAHQQNPSPVHATRQHAMVSDGSKSA